MTMPDSPVNVSSLVVKTSPERLQEVIAALEESGLCDVHFHDESGKIIITIEGCDGVEEMRKMREILNLPHVLSADLAYSYCENELNEARGRSTKKKELLRKGRNNWASEV